MVQAQDEFMQTLSPVPVELVVAFSIWEDIKLTWVLYVAWTLRLILSISLIVSSFPWRISNSFQVCQKLAVTWKIHKYIKRNYDVHTTDGNVTFYSETGNGKRWFSSPWDHRSGSSRSRLLWLYQSRPVYSPCQQIGDTCPLHAHQEGPG